MFLDFGDATSEETVGQSLPPFRDRGGKRVCLECTWNLSNWIQHFPVARAIRENEDAKKKRTIAENTARYSMTQRGVGKQK